MKNIEPAPKAGWIQTYTGRAIWPLEPDPAHVCIEDIAHALSMKCRYTGHVREFYSVAEHSVYVSHIVPPEDALWGLLHDAPEAYLPDIARPIKSAIVGFKVVENMMMAAIATRFGLPGDMPESIKHADLVMLATESRDLMSAPPYRWLTTEGITPLEQTIKPLLPIAAKASFLSRFKQLVSASVRDWMGA